MSELKMSDWFKLPVDCSHIVDDSGVAGSADSISIDGHLCLTDHHVEKVEIAINSHDKLTAENKRLREALIELVDTGMSNERQLAESFLEKFEPSSALVAARKALSQEGE